MKATLTRMTKEDFPCASWEEDEFAKECFEKLQYGPMIEQQKEAAKRHRMLETLAMAGVYPFKPELVRRYQEEKKLLMSWPRWFCWSLITSVLAVPTTAVWLSVATGDFRFLLILLGLGMVAIVFSAIHDQCLNYRWKLYPISSYKREVPEFALQTALDVQKACVQDGLQCFFYVESLEIDEPRDPFLQVAICESGGRSIPFHLEVWNEPGFKQAREL